ncbi:MAG: cell division protein SepF [Acidimicrobiales bacterium]|jgi:cell division inhibitor SepF
MAAGFMKRTMAYLGLADDEYDEYDEYEPRMSAPSRMAAPRSAMSDGYDDQATVQAPASSGGSIRTLTREEPVAASSVTPRPSVVRAIPAETAARVHIVAPTEFGDAQHIADRLLANQPVIVNMQVADRELMRRIIDFCSGATYALSGKMERVADRVFLVTPTNVKVSAEERQRLQENGLLRP